MYVTGLAGFIGSRLTKSLIEDGHIVYGKPSCTRTGDWDNLIRTDFKLSHFFNPKMKLNYVFHLGMPSSSPMYKAFPQCVAEAISVSIEALELARRNKAKFIYASSSSVYNGNTVPFREDMPIHITDYYTEVRYWLERLVKLYNTKYGVESVGLRFFSVYGPNDYKKKQYANVVTQFALDMINGKQPILYGDGEQRRDFVHVDDVVRALKFAMEYGHNDVFNVGTGKSYSFNDSIKIIQKTLNSRITPIYTENEIHNYVFDTLADTEKATKGLNFIAKHNFKEKYPEYVRELKHFKDTNESRHAKDAESFI